VKSFNMVMTEAYFGAAKRGAFDHWKGETVPLRGPNREIIGEATIKDVDHREDGCVYVVVESEIDVDFNAGARVAHLMTGRNPMSFKVHEAVSIPHQPKREDDVARWLKRIRDEYQPNPFDSRESGAYWAIDGILDEYRARADYGLTLDDDLSELPDGY
jgi:hypothetical protein